MKHLGLRLVAVGSLVVSLAYGATRPEYGGTAHVLVRAVPLSLVPDSPQPGPVASDNVLRLLFDTLVMMDDSGRVQPALAVSWQADREARHWRFQLRPGVAFDDGSPLAPEIVAASLRLANSAWSVSAKSGSIEIELVTSNAGLLAELAQARNSIVKRGGAIPGGTGPFRVTNWVPGKTLVLAARDDYWGGRPFLNSIEIEFGKSYREQMVMLELGKADVVEIAPEQARRVAIAGRQLSQSRSLELIALIFAREPASPNESKLRDALALCIDRVAINNAFLGGEGQPAGGILPAWMTGYEFVFRSDANVARALELRGEVSQAPAWTLAYDPTDPVSQFIAERIALNARDVGIRIQPVSAMNADVRLVRLRWSTLNPEVALKDINSGLGLPELKPADDNVQELYQTESAIIHAQRVIPLFHLPVNYGLSAAVKGWKAPPDGSWPLTNVWLSAEKP